MSDAGNLNLSEICVCYQTSLIDCTKSRLLMDDYFFNPKISFVTGNDGHKSIFTSSATISNYKPFYLLQLRLLTTNTSGPRSTVRVTHFHTVSIEKILLVCNYFVTRSVEMFLKFETWSTPLIHRPFSSC